MFSNGDIEGKGAKITKTNTAPFGPRFGLIRRGMARLFV